MKTRTTIIELNQEDLVDLLCTDGSNWLDIRTGETSGVEFSETDCLEDKLAKCLLAGHKIKCYDYYAEGVTYGDLGRVVKKDGEAVYFVGLQDIIKGLQACADGTFKEDCEGTISWLKECFTHFADPEYGRMQMDLPEAEALMQVIMFGKLIYG